MIVGGSGGGGGGGGGTTGTSGGVVKVDELHATVGNVRDLTFGTLTGRASTRTEVLTGLTVDGDLRQFNGDIYGSGTGLTGFKERTNASMEDRLAQYATSARRLYVSTTGSDANHGRSRDRALRTIKKAAALATTLTVIWVESGTYVEDNPIYVPPNVAVIGDSLRNTILLAANPRLDYFHVTNMNYVSQLRFVDMRSPGFCCAFPCSLATVGVADGGITASGADGRVPVLYSPEGSDGYYLEARPPVDTPGPSVAETTYALVEGIAAVVEEGLSEAFPVAATANPGGMLRAAELLLANKAFLQAEVLAWVAAQTPPINLNEAQLAKCSRDVGFIVDAVAADLRTGSYVESLRAATAYFQGAASVLPNDQVTPTADALRHLRDKARTVATGAAVTVADRAQTAVAQEFFGAQGTEAEVPPTGILDDALARMQALAAGFAAVVASTAGNAEGLFPALALVDTTATERPAYGVVADIIVANKDALRAQTLAWVVTNFPGLNLTGGQLASCSRDVGFIVDALAEDLRLGENTRTSQYASLYFVNAVSVLTAGTQSPTAQAVVQLAGFAAALVRTHTVPAATVRAQALLAGFADVVGVSLSEPFLPEARSLERSPACDLVAGIVDASRAALQDAMGAWLERPRTGQPTLAETLGPAGRAACLRDTGFILEALTFDLRNGSYLRTAEYARKYYDGVTGASVLPQDQVTPTADAIRYLATQVAAVVQARTSPANAFDQSRQTTYTSLLAYRNLNGTADAPGVTLTLELPAPKMYVGYRIRDTNLKKWRLEARQAAASDVWDVLHAADGEATAQLTVTPVGEPDAAVAAEAAAAAASSAVTGLLEGVAGRIAAADAAFPRTAYDNPGNFVTAATAMAQNRRFLQAEVVAWVRTQQQLLDSLTQPGSDKLARCERDVGFIVDAVTADLRTGGFARSLEAASAYYDAVTGVTVLQTANTRGPTVDAVRVLRDLAAYVVRDEPVPASLLRQSTVPQTFAGSTEAAVTFGTSALRGYSYYRLVLLQTLDDAAFRLGGVEFLEIELPEPFADGPTGIGTVIESFEVADGGSGYSASPAPTVQVVNFDGTSAPVPAQADATVVNGAITAVTLRPRTFSSVQQLTLTAPGSGYLQAPAVTIAAPPAGPGAAAAQAVAWINKRGAVVALELISGGAGYSTDPLAAAPVVTLGQPGAGGVGATATASLRIAGVAWGLQRGRGYKGAARVTVSGGSTPAVVRATMTDDFAELAVPLYDSATARNVDARGRLVSLRVRHPGGGYVEPPTVSIPAPRRLQPVIVGSPYVQNCSNITGPFDTTGEKIPVTWPLPWNPLNVYNVSGGDGYDASRPSRTDKGLRVLDNRGAGGGIRIDGRCVNAFSPLRSFVVDAFTQVNQGGIGFLLLNLAYAQFVSTFGTFCDTHAIAVGGSFANFSNSVTDFGRRGLLARGYYRVPYLTGRAVALPGDLTTTQYSEYSFVPGYGYAGGLSGITLATRGKGYVSAPSVVIAPPAPDGTNNQLQTAQATARVASNGEVSDVVVVQSAAGRGYRAPPAVTISGPTGYAGTDTETLVRATATAQLRGVPKLRVEITGGTPLRLANNRKPDTLSIVRIHGAFYVVTGASEVVVNNVRVPNTYDVTFGGTEGAPPYVDLEHGVSFYQVSYVSTGSHVFEYCGDQLRGCTYNSLPEYGGVPDPTFEIVREAPAKVFFTSSDHIGNQRIGDFFSVNQATGDVKLDAKNFDLSRLSSLGPFVRNGVVQGVAMREVSANEQLVASTGAPDGSTVPTQTAVKSYVDVRAVPQTGGTTGAFLRYTGGAPAYAWTQFTVESLGVVSVVGRVDVVSGLVADGDAVVYGNVSCGTMQASAGVEIGLPAAGLREPPEPRSMTFDLVSNTQLRVRVRGDDGTVRSATLTLA